MLDTKSLAVLTYLENHFSSNNKPISAHEIHINGLSLEDIRLSINVLDKKGYLNINHKYISDPIESINT